VQDKGLTARTERISAVVVTFNRKAMLEECLTALLNQTRHLDEIIVIDNASTDGTDQLIKTKFAATTYVKLGENIGGAGGFHEGMKLAYEKGYDWIWVMDDDAIPKADALQRLLDCSAERDERVYALASAVLNRDETVFPAHRRLFDAKTMIETIIGAEEYARDYFPTDTASFVGFLVSHKAIEQIGLPLKEMFIYFDDTEYSLRIRKRGTILTVPGSRIVHGEPEKASGDSPWGQSPTGWKKYYAIRNRIYTYKTYGKHSPANYMKFFRETYIDIRNAMRSNQPKSYNIRVSLCATFDGLRGKLGKNTHFLPV